MEPTPNDIAKCKEVIYARSHLSFPPSREAQLRRWIKQRTAEGKFSSFEQYLSAVSSDPLEFARLIAHVTTRETYFFRMPEQFEVLNAVVVPAVAEREGKKSLAALSGGASYRMRLRAWSAGCATGQETYSVSMQILEAVRYRKAWDIKVLGTDINAEAIIAARTGRYDQSRLGKMSPGVIERYFDLSGVNEIAVTAPVREITEFDTLNLRSLPDIPSFRSAFDIIFCRNVLIYFDLPAQQRLVSALWDCLVPGGYLFTGEGEVLHLYDHSFIVKEHGACIFYQKPEEV